MNIQRIILGVCNANCYIVSDENKNACIFDVPDNGEGLWDYIESKNLSLQAVIITHAHADHIMGIEKFMERAKEAQTHVKVYIHKADAPAMTDPATNLSNLLFGEKFRYIGTLECLSDNDVINVGKMSFKVLSTPGHTPGSACFYEEKENVLFSGDTLFNSSIGRVDFPGGSLEDMKKSLRRLFTLPDSCRVCPGHFGYTTIGDEKMVNGFI